MKIKFQILTVLCFLNLGINAQHWYSDRARWRYNKQELLSFPAHGYIEYAVAKDILINDTNAKLILVDTMYYNGIESSSDSLFVYESNSKIFYWDENRFKLMFDFGLKAGDTLAVEINPYDCDSVSPIIIDSISILDDYGQSLQVQHLTYTLYAENIYGYNIEVNEKIIEKIGYEGAFIFSPECLIDDDFVYSGLRCYSDDSIHYTNEWWENHFPGVTCDSLINDSTTGIKKNHIQDFVVYPNPCHDFITVSMGKDNIETFYMEIYNSLGEKVEQISNNQSTKIDLSDYQSGVYFLRIYQYANKICIFKIIKN